MNTPIRILCLEDEKNDVELNIAALEKDGVNFILTQVDRQDKFFDQLQTQKFDIILSDYKLPGFAGMEVFRLTKQKGFDIPFIIVSGSLGEAVAIESLKEGVTDYVLKDNLKRLAPAIRRAMDEIHKARQRKQAEEELVRKEHLLSESQRIAHIGSWVYDMAGNITWTEETYRIYGVAPDTFIPDANSFINLIHPDDRTAMQNWIDRYVVGEKPGELEFRIVSPDGSVRYLRGQGEINYDAENKPFYMTGTVQDITERKRAEDAMRESESRFRAIIESSPVPYALNDEQQNITYLNAAFVKTFGYNLEEIPTLADWWPKAYPDADYRQWAAATWQKRLDTAKQTGTLFEPMELNICCKDGTIRTALVCAAPLGESFKGVHIVILHDITERKKTENVLRERQRFIESLINLSPDILYIYDIIDRKNVYINNGIHTILSYSVSEVQEMGNQLLSILMHPDDLKMYLEETYPKYFIVKDNEPVIHQYRMKHKNGEWYWLDCSEIIYLREPDGEPRQIFGVVHDITDRKRAEEKLRRSEHNLAEAERIGNTGSCEYDVASDTASWSENMFRLFDVDPAMPKELVFKHFVENLVHPDDRQHIISVFTDALSGKRPYDLEYRIIRKDGSVRDIHALAETLRDSHGKAIRMIGKVEDITKRKKADNEILSSRQQLRELAGRLQAIREDERTSIAREIHDELGQSLTGMKIDLAWIKTKLRKDQKPLIARAEELNGLLDALIQNVRRISSELRPGILDDFGLIAAIEWQAQEFQRRTKIESKFVTNVESIDLDKSRSTALFRIIQESLTNVVRHTHASQVSIDLEVDASEIILCISDNGSGITPEEIADTKSLGLLGMKERVHLIGGRINFVRNEFSGTSVVVTVPIDEHSDIVIES